MFSWLAEQNAQLTRQNTVLLCCAVFSERLLPGVEYKWCINDNKCLFGPKQRSLIFVPFQCFLFNNNNKKQKSSLKGKPRLEEGKIRSVAEEAINLAQQLIFSSTSLVETVSGHNKTRQDREEQTMFMLTLVVIGQRSEYANMFARELTNSSIRGFNNELAAT